MQGVEKPDRELLDALGLCSGLVREGSVYRFLAENRLGLFPDGMFADLFGALGRPSQPASVVAVVLVLQALEGCSDREAAERLRCDVRWRAAAGLAVDDEGFHCSVLSLWRARLRSSGRPERVFDAVRELAAACGALSRGRRRALDSTVLDDAVTAQDTVTMVSSQIRRVRRLVGAAAALEPAHDYDGRAKPVCDWSDPAERAWLVDELVTDALAVLDAPEGLDLTDEQADAVGLLAVVAGQDVEADPGVPGRWRIARRVARGRVVSTADPEARHAHKTRSQRRDGYKAHIVAEPDTGTITAVEPTAADASDARVGARLLNTDPTCSPDTDDDPADTDTDTDDDDDTDDDPADTDTDTDDDDPADTDDDDDDTDTDDDDTDTDPADTDTDDDPADTDTDDDDTDDDPADTDTDDDDTDDDPADDDPADTDTDDDDTDDDLAGTDDDLAGTDDDPADTDDGTDDDPADTDDDGGRLVLADSAYASGEALGSFTDAGWDTAVKPIERPPRIAGGFTRDDFATDTGAQTVTCPAGHTKAATSAAARFGRLCAACPLRTRCTTSQRGRSVTVDAHEAHRQANKARWRRARTRAAYRRHRPMAERTIAWLTRGKARRVPYRGVAANNLWLTHRAAAVNPVRLANLGAAHNDARHALPAAA